MVLGALLSHHQAVTDVDEPERDQVGGSRKVTPPTSGAAVPPAPLAATPRIVRRQRPSTATGPSLSSPLLSGRSLEPTVKAKRFAVLREHRAITATALVVVLVVLAIGIGKYSAERAADAATSDRAAQITELLAGATPKEFLAFNAGVKTLGSLAAQVRDQDGFVNVKAIADLAFIRIQPNGWWAGFTERCIVAAVRPDGVTVTVPKTACIRVAVPAG